MRSSKLAPKLLGPYEVIEQIRNNIRCTHMQLGTEHTFHSNRVTPFYGSPDTARHLGLLDRDEFIVEKILRHRGDWHSKTSMEFLVRWQGYDSASDSWEPWSNQRNVAALHTYLRDHQLTKHIPRQFR